MSDSSHVTVDTVHPSQVFVFLFCSQVAPSQVFVFILQCQIALMSRLTQSIHLKCLSSGDTISSVCLHLAVSDSSHVTVDTVHPSQVFVFLFCSQVAPSQVFVFIFCSQVAPSQVFVFIFCSQVAPSQVFVFRHIVGLASLCPNHPSLAFLHLSVMLSTFSLSSMLSFLTWSLSVCGRMPSIRFTSVTSVQSD